jgi:hypothetical protein
LWLMHDALSPSSAKACPLNDHLQKGQPSLVNLFSMFPPWF